MDKVMNTEPKSGAQKEQKIDYKSEVVRMFAHMDVVSERISRNLSETELLQAETRAMLAQMQAGSN